MAHFSWGSGSGFETESKPSIMLHLFPWLYFSFRLKRKQKKTQNSLKSHKSSTVRTVGYNPTSLNSGIGALISRCGGLKFDGALKMVQSNTTMCYFILFSTLN